MSDLYPFSGLDENHFLGRKDVIKKSKSPCGVMHAFSIRSDLWRNGSVIKFFFFGGNNQQKELFRNSLNVWKDCGIGLIFSEVFKPIDSDIRISFVEGSAWSCVGIKCLHISKEEATMNLGLGERSGTYLHEIGHMLGLRHSHLSLHETSPNGFRNGWNKENVYNYFRQPPNSWSKKKVDINLFRKFDYPGLEWEEFDGKSIMCYRIRASFLSDDYKKAYPDFRNGIPSYEELQESDRNLIRQLYPPILNQQLPAGGCSLKYKCSDSNCGCHDSFGYLQLGYDFFDMAEVHLNRVCVECSRGLNGDDILQVVFRNCVVNYVHVAERKSEETLVVRGSLIFQTERTGKYLKLTFNVTQNQA